LFDSQDKQDTLKKKQKSFYSQKQSSNAINVSKYQIKSAHQRLGASASKGLQRPTIQARGPGTKLKHAERGKTIEKNPKA
jgi:hypothetical protein